MTLHVPFLRAMTELANDDPAWRVLGAGYLVVRVFDDWLLLGPTRIDVDLGLSNLSTALTELPEEYRPERRVLEESLTILRRAQGPDPVPVVGPLLAYGVLLENRGAWGPAADVYHTVAGGLEAFDVLADPLSVATTRLREGACWRNAHDYEQATASYKAVAGVGSRTKNDVLRLQAGLGLAHITRARGDLPEAEKTLSALLEDAGRCASQVTTLLESAILHSRGAVRQARGRYAEAMIDLYDAYRKTPDAIEQELILADLGVCAGEAGYRDAARNALEVIALTARRLLARQTAITNLLEIVVLQGDRSAFDRWCGELVPVQCSPLLRAYAKVYIARGIERFKGAKYALPEFHKAADYAAEVGVHQAQFEALKDIERLERAETVAATAAAPVPSNLNYIAEALADLRVLAGTQG